MKWSNLLSTRHAIGIVLFVLASYLHNNSHHILASLRKDKKGSFDQVQWCNLPNYLHAKLELVCELNCGGAGQSTGRLSSAIWKQKLRLSN